MIARIVVVAMVAVAAPAAAQAPRDSVAAVEAFVARLREATERYRDQSAAVTDGYRRIGPDFPGMGEHWISVPLLLDGGIDPARPPILEYAVLNGKMTLVGAAFAVLLAAHESPPELSALPVDASAWHYHGGTVSEESFVSGHAHGVHAHSDKPRVAVLHVWAWLDNPGGTFATDNWALPFARLGLPVPSVPPSVDVAHAVSLAAGGGAYYRRIIALRGSGNGADEVELARAAEEIRAVLREGPPEEGLARAGVLWVGLRGRVAGLP